MKAKKQKELTFELGMENLKTISEQLESGQLSLDESLLLFEEGIQQYRKLNAILESAQIKIETILLENKERSTVDEEDSDEL